MEGKTCRSLLRSLTALALSLVLLLTPLTGTVRAAAVQTPMSMQQAVSLAVQSSKELTSQTNKILLKRMKYVESVKGIRAKIKDLRTFRWTPLFGFKFPQPLDLVDEFDMIFKPTVLQADIDKLVHQMDDVYRKVVEKTESQFFTAYQLQTSVDFTQANLDDALEQRDRTHAKLAVGEATQTDADRADVRVETLQTRLTSQLRDLSKAKEKLTDLTGVDVTTGYVFRNPFRVANIPREELDKLVEYTLEWDHQFFECKTNESVALMTLEAYESLMRNQYGSKMDGIQNFINMSKQGMDIDSAAFQLAYNDMIKRLDRPWDGSFWIIFFKFSKELLKGPISGTRYIQDEMYAVFTACMEYSAARKEREALEKELTGQVRDTFENVVTSYNAYLALQKSADRNKAELDRVLLLNRQGKATFEEVADVQEAYQDSQQDTLDSLCDYNKLLTEFDKLTCGAVSIYLNGTAFGMESGEGGDAYAILDPINDPYYYIYNSVANMTFNLGISIPEDFEPAVDSFEVWYGDTQIGKRTMVGKELRHLTLDYGDSGTLKLRLYNGDQYVDECEINTMVPRDRLDISRAEPPAPKPRVLGSYKLHSRMDRQVKTTELTLLPNATENVQSYRLRFEGNTVLTSEPVPIDQPFVYLDLMLPALGDVEITLYRADGTEQTAYFDTFNLQLTDMKTENGVQTSTTEKS